MFRVVLRRNFDTEVVVQVYLLAAETEVIQLFLANREVTQDVIHGVLRFWEQAAEQIVHVR